MRYYKQFLVGSALALAIAGCGGAGVQSADNTLAGLAPQMEETPAVSLRMTDVGNGYSNQQAVDIDYAALTLPKYIVDDLPLLTEGPAGSDINWSLLNSGDFSLAIAGTSSTLQVGTRTSTQHVKLAAFINYDLNASQPEANRTKEFCVTILPLAQTPQQKVAQDAKIVCGNLFPKTIDLNSSDPYAQCSLPTQGANDSNITWEIPASSSGLIDINTTTHSLYVPDWSQITDKTVVKIKGTFTYADANTSACYTVVILPQHPAMTHQQICDMINAAADKLKSSFPGTIQPDSEGRYPKLPLQDGDVQIAWSSCDTSKLTIENDGTMIDQNHSGTDTKVKIRATLSYADVHKSLCFCVEVPTR